MNKKIKVELRKKYLKILKELNSEQKKQWDDIIFQKFINSSYFKKYNVFGIYFSLSYEVDTVRIIEFLLANNKKVALPRINGQDLEFCYINSISDLLIDNKWNIYQPKKNCQVVNNKDLEIIILPLVAFNKNKQRLGHGAGYYDRFLHNSVNFFKLALAYKIQEISSNIIFCDNWDIMFDDIVTN